MALDSKDDSSGRGGRPSAQLATRLREEIASGRIKAGDFMPTERELAVRHDVARKTVGRALGILEAEGLIHSSPRHGHRVLSRGHDPARGAPLAYVRHTAEEPERWGPLHGQLLTALEAMAGSRGWSLLAVTSRGRPQAEVMEQLRTARVCGLILDTLDPELLRLVSDAGMPAVMVDAWVEDAGVDAVIQDSYLGGLQAGRWLLSRGHRRIAWFGEVARTFQSRERFGGAAAALVAENVQIPDAFRIEPPWDDFDGSARRLLERRDRPTAVLALWREQAMAVVRAARELGLVLGRDLDVVGWATEEQYETEYRAELAGGPVPPAVVWSVRQMAEAAMLRLIQRRENPGVAPVQIRIPTKLKE